MRVPTKYKMLIIDEIGHIPMDIQDMNFFFRLNARATRAPMQNRGFRTGLILKNVIQYQNNHLQNSLYTIQ